MLRVGSLFSGLGGFELGLERTGGFETAWFCEQEPFSRGILAKHWPGVPCYPDVRRLRGADVEPVEVLTGGFPCQNISSAGKGEGLAGAQSGLWSEYARLVSELRPRYVIVENVPFLRRRGLEVVLADLMACGYDAEWDGISASALGAPHRRDRLWIVAYPREERRSQGEQDLRRREQDAPGGGAHQAADPRGPRQPVSPGDPGHRAEEPEPSRAGGPRQAGPEGAPEPGVRGVANELSEGLDGSFWAAEWPGVPRVKEGVPDRRDRLKALGNALIPGIPEWIGNRILQYEEERR